MRATAERASPTVSRPPVVRRKAFFRPIQTKLTVNAPGDRHEKEAETTADHVMRMPSDDRLLQRAEQHEPEGVQRAERPEEEQIQKAEAETPEEEKVQKAEAETREEEKVQKAEAETPEEEKVQKAEAETPEEEKVQKAEAETPEEEKVQRRAGSGAPVVTGAVQAGIRSKKTGGRGLDGGTRRFMESRFGADFREVRVHDDAESARLSNRLSARAFTTGKHIFFGRDRYSPGTSEGRHLLAHELTHTIQQGAAVQRSPKVSVSITTPTVQRFGIRDALDYFADKVNFLPGFRLLTIVLGFNPINMASVDRSAGNILRALIELLPLGSVITTALENYGVFERAGAWIEQQLAAFRDIGGQIRRGIDAFLDSLSWKDILDLSGVWDRAKAIFTVPISNLINFGKGLVRGLLDLVRDAVLRPLAEFLRPTRGYDLLCAVLGRDPVTGDPVPRNAETLIGGFMKLIGRQDIWDNIQKGNAVGRAWAWFQGALTGLLGFVLSIPGQVMATLRSITWRDIVTIVGVASKVLGLFASLAGQFFGWASGTVVELLQILFSVVAPGVMPYVKKAKAAFRSILDNPIGFVGQLVRAARLGFELFGRNIVFHLKAALIKWITGPLGEAGVYIPKSFSLIEIVKCVLSVLGLTWQNIRTKLLKIIPEPVLVVLEKSAAILVTLVRDGPVAAWEQIKAELSELKEMLIARIIELVSVEIVKAAVIKVVSMINPAGAVIQAIIAIYNTIMFFVERISQIASTVAAFVDSIAAIAAGQVMPAARKVEQTMANALVLVVSFLARLVGLGGIPKKIVGIIQRIRRPIDKGLDRIVAWLGKMLKKIRAKAKSVAARFLRWWTKKVPVSGGGEAHTLTFQGERRSAQLVLRSTPKKPSEFLKSTAERIGIEEKDSKEPVETEERLEAMIAETQDALAEFDAPERPTPSGKAADKADSLSRKLDGRLRRLGSHISRTLRAWKVSDEFVGKFDVLPLRFSKRLQRKVKRRPKWKKSTTEALVGPDGELAGPRPGTIKEGYARRHIVSSKDMADHYESRLSEKKVSKAKLLLEQRGSAPGSHTPVKKPDKEGIKVAARTRHRKFFNYVKNLFLGDSRENSSIQENLDAGKFRGAEDKLNEHVAHVTRVWAFDSAIHISRTTPTS